MTDQELVKIVPSARQLRLQKMEFYAFVHFTVNTFTNREWGDGTEDPAVFNPIHFDAEQWVQSVAAAGMKGLILTCKHHDGFCLWPSRYTRHSVASSPWREGKGDVVRAVSAACAKHGIAFGVYLSPWDRNQPLYGSGKPYDDYFIAQLTELLTGYGEIFSVWFDGACGEGPNGKKQYYDWDRYYRTIRELQPDACIHVCGPDIRWCGNEAGDTREAEWSVVPTRTKDTEKVASLSQQQDDTEFRRRTIRAWDRDLGSRAILADETDLIWYPAEVNTSIRPGWFWHAEEDDRVRPLAELTDIYEKSVGGNATLLLNIPPTRDGLFHPHDVQRLQEIGAYIKAYYTDNLTDGAVVDAPPAAEGAAASHVLRADDTFYTPAYAEGPVSITLRLQQPGAVDRVVLAENLTFSQRVERYRVELLCGQEVRAVMTGSVIGNKRIIPFDHVQADAVRVTLEDYRVAPVIAFIGVYRYHPEGT